MTLEFRVPFRNHSNQGKKKPATNLLRAKTIVAYLLAWEKAPSWAFADAAPRMRTTGIC